MLSKLICEESFKFANDKYYNSPFSEEAKKSFYLFNGGKLDDISVSLGKIEEWLIKKNY